MCSSRDKAIELAHAPPQENYVYKSECRLQLHQVDFPTFQGAIKRFGYRIDLNDEHMKSISKEIKLNTVEMNEQKNSPFSVVYKDEKFFFKEKRHTVPNLLKMGFLLCKHYSPEEQSHELWHLINPKLDDFVTKEQVAAFLNDLCYVAIDMNYSKFVDSYITLYFRSFEIG